LVSNNSGCHEWVMLPSGLCSSNQLDGTESKLEVWSHPTSNSCTDFVLQGMARRSEDGFGLEAVARALREPKQTSGIEPVTLMSNNNGCHHFMLPARGLFSAALAVQDVMWIESVSGLKRGTLLKACREEAEGNSATEISWEPLARYRALARTLRLPRGSKSLEHLEVLRKSDPLIHIQSWIDWSEVWQCMRHTHAYQANQQALAERASRNKACHEHAAPPAVGASPMPVKVSVKQGGSLVLKEHASADSVLVNLLDPLCSVDMQCDDEWDEDILASPTSVAGLGPHGTTVQQKSRTKGKGGSGHARPHQLLADEAAASPFSLA